jgi:hypothetical protein
MYYTCLVISYITIVVHNTFIIKRTSAYVDHTTSVFSFLNSEIQFFFFFEFKKKMTYKFWEGAINDYEKLLETGERSDVIIYAGENEKEFRAHSAILCVRSEYFHAALSKNWVEKKDGMFIFKKPNIESNLFQIILR